MACGDRVGQSLLVDDAAPSGVDEQGALGEAVQLVGSDETPGGGSEGQLDREHVRAFQYLLLGHISGCRLGFSQVVVEHGVHDRSEPLCDGMADVAESEQADGESRQFTSRRMVRPLPLPDLGVAPVQAAHQAVEGGDDPVGDSVAVVAGGVGHGDACLRGSRHVDGVVSHARLLHEGAGCENRQEVPVEDGTVQEISDHDRGPCTGRLEVPRADGGIDHAQRDVRREPAANLGLVERGQAAHEPVVGGDLCVVGVHGM